MKLGNQSLNKGIKLKLKSLARQSDLYSLLLLHHTQSPTRGLPCLHPQKPADIEGGCLLEIYLILKDNPQRLISLQDAVILLDSKCFDELIMLSQ